MSIVNLFPEWLLIGTATFGPFLFWLYVYVAGNFSDYPKRIVISNRILKRQIETRKFHWLMAGFRGLAFMLIFALISAII